MSIDKFLDKIYHEEHYNCAHFVCEVWKELKGYDISKTLAGALTRPSRRSLVAHDLRTFELLTVPSSPCVALFQSKRKDTHVGIWFLGKILHITSNGVEWTLMETVLMNFNSVRFYNVKKNHNS